MKINGEQGITTYPASVDWGPFFAGLSDEYLQLIATFSHRSAVGSGTTIFLQGRPAKHLYIIQQGKVGLEMLVPSPSGGGTRPTVVSVLGPGEAFGWSALVEPYVFSLSAVALDRCELIMVEGEALREAMRRYLSLGYVVLSNLTKLMAQRLRQTRQALIYERGWATVA